MAKRSSNSTKIMGGALRGKNVVVPSGLEVRPMRARVREALFNRVGDRIRGGSFLDVFSGSGAIAFEALSRGCYDACLIETSPRVIEQLNRNILNLGLKGRAKICALNPYQDSIPGGPYRMIFLDPPFPDYANPRISPFDLAFEIALNHLEEGGVMGLEYPQEVACPEAPEGLELLNSKLYGSTWLSLWQILEES